MPIKSEYVEAVIKQIAMSIRRADPAKMEITYARAAVASNPKNNIDTYELGDLTITIEIKS